jgi:O-antigen ligase
LRYKGETAGTIAGSKELDINTFTTNRYQIFLGDVELWRENFLLGVGAGASKELRPTTEEVPTAAHVELSRLLAEHGLFGLFFFLTILVFPFLIISQNKDSLNKAILIAFFIIGLYTSFHAAMRTYVTPLFISMSLLTIRETPHKKKTKPYLDSVNLLDSQ